MNQSDNSTVTAPEKKKDARRYEASGEPNVLRLVGAKDFYFSMKKGTKRWLRDLNTTNLAEAKKRAADLRNLINAGKWEALRGIKERAGWATMPQLYEAYLAASTIKTKQTIVAMMRHVIRRAGGDPEGSCSQLDAKLVWDFQQVMKKAAGDDQIKMARALRSANSEIKSARQLFAEAILPAYSKLEIPAHVLDRARDPKAKGFMTANLLAAPAVQYIEPPAAVIHRISANYHTLKKSDAGSYAAFLLGAFLGLRNNEVSAARWDWVEPDSEKRTWLKIRITADYATKTKRGRDVEIPPAVLAELLAVRGAEVTDLVPGDPIYLVPAHHKTDRTDRVFRRCNKWLREQGLDRQLVTKGFYELRKYFGNVKASESGSTYQAARAMGNSPEIVEKYYSSAQGRTPLKIAGPKVSKSDIRKAVRKIEKTVASHRTEAQT